MAKRKPALKTIPESPDLEKLLQQARDTIITEEEIQEQRISFAYGNAPSTSRITKDSVRKASKSLLMPKIA